MAIVTGPTSGLGKHTVRALAAVGVSVILAGRSVERMAAAAKEITAQLAPQQVDLRCMVLDVGNLASVRAFAQAFLELRLPLHLLINNAGALVSLLWKHTILFI